MLELEPNTLAFMTAVLEQSSKKLKSDVPEARKLIADKLKACARSGKTTMAALTEASDGVVAELNGQTQSSSGWSRLFRGR